MLNEKPGIIAYYFFICHTNLPAQFPFPKLKLNYYTVADGLSNNDVTCVTQDHNGFIWLGTSNGLNRFDGTEFLVYKKNASDTNSISSNDIHQLTEDASQRLWIATGEGLCWLDLKTNKIHRYNNSALSGQIIYYVLVDGNNNLWIATKEYVHCLNLKNFSLQSFKISNEEEYKYQPRANRLFLYNKESLLITGWDGLYCLDIKTSVIHHILKTNYSIGTVTDAGNGNIWLATWGLGALLFNFYKQQIIEKIILPAPWQRFNNSSIISDIQPIRMPDGNKYNWISGNHGVMIADAATNKCLMVYNPETGLPLTSNSALTKQIFNDKDGNLWICSEKGFCRIDLHQWFYIYDLSNLNFQTEVNGIYQDATSPNRLWIALWGADGGIGSFDISAQNILNISAPENKSSNNITNASNYVFSCVRNGNDGFWLSTNLGGVHYFNVHDKTFTYFHDPLKQHPPYYNIILKLLQAPDKKLWFACKAGLGCLDPVNKSYHYFYYYDTSRPNLLGDHRSIDVMLDKKQRLWITTQFDGCYIFNRDKSSFKKIPVLNLNNSEYKGGIVQTFAEDNLGNVWLGTAAGLFLFDEKSQTFRYQNIKGLPDYILAMCADDKNNLWLLSGAELFKYNTLNKSLQHFTISDGLLPEDGISINKISDNLMYLGYRAKFLLFHPDDLKPKPNIEPVRLTQMKILAKDSLVSVASPNELIKFNYTDNDIRFDFKLLDFSDAHNTEYAFMLQGLDDAWNYSGNANSAIYTNIPEGKYTFIVKAANASGNWSQLYKLAYFSIATPYWHSWWFKMAIAIIVAAILYTIYFFKKKTKKQMAAVRTKIARDLHDDVGSTLSSLHMVSALARKKIKEDLNKTSELLDKITESSERMTGNMQDIVWAVNPLNDSFAQIIARMQKFSAQMLEAKNIELTFTADEKIKSLKLPLQYRGDLFMIFKEAINNLAKYSEANHADISLYKYNKHFILKIQDDGIGFNPQQVKYGNGLRNMQQRAKNLNATLTISSEKNIGTTIVLEFII